MKGNIQKSVSPSVLALMSLILFIALFLSACSTHKDSDLAAIRDKGTLIIGITDFAPMDYLDPQSDTWIGFDAEAARLIASDLGVEPVFCEIEWNNRVSLLQDGTIDVIWNGMTYSEELEDEIDCTDSYLYNAQTVVVLKREEKHVTSLNELSFAVEKGSAGEKAASAYGYHCTAFPSQMAVLEAVSKGDCEAGVIDSIMVGSLVGDHGRFPNLLATVELTREEYAIGCRKGSDLTAYLNSALRKYYQNGTLVEIADKYDIRDALVSHN